LFADAAFVVRDITAPLIASRRTADAVVIDADGVSDIDRPSSSSSASSSTNSTAPRLPCRWHGCGNR
jgi:hypothetical protein